MKQQLMKLVVAHNGNRVAFHFDDPKVAGEVEGAARAKGYEVEVEHLSLHSDADYAIRAMEVFL